MRSAAIAFATPSGSLKSGTCNTKRNHARVPMDRWTDIRSRPSNLFWMTGGRQTGLRSKAQRVGLRELPGETEGARKPLHVAASEERHSINSHCMLQQGCCAEFVEGSSTMSTTLLRATRIIASGARARPTACLYTLPLANWQRGGLSRRSLAPLAMQVVCTCVPAYVRHISGSGRTHARTHTHVGEYMEV